VQLSHFTTRITYGFTNPMPTTTEGPFMLTAKDVYDGRIDYENARRTSWESYRNELTEKSRPRVGDVLLTKDGSIGRVALCDRADVCINQSVALLQPNDRIEPRFLKYLLEVPHYQRRMEGDADGTTIKHIYITRVDKMQVAVPPLAEQKAIAAVLGALDDKIELNRRMNATLEAMARALFQSWFVDFDPVRAKLDRRKPIGLDESTAALFPDSFQDSELGHIPKGWRVLKFGEFIERLSVGQKYEQKTVFPVGRVPVLDQGKSGVIGFHNDEPGVRATLDNPIAVFANHTCYMRLITFPFSAIQNVLPFVGSGVNTFWAYYATEGRLSFSEYKGHWPDFVIEQSVVPPRELTDAFANLVKPLIAQIRNNEDESRTLATLRDTLLPKLLSGELRIDALDEMKEAIV
jgi:type I restriction enzyme S subunit